VGAAKKVVSEFGGQVPRTMEEMLTIPGAARKTANVVLGTAYGIALGVVVDTHVQRIAQRLDLTKNTDPVKIERDLMQAVPEDKWILFAHQVILHGRALCQARKPKCGECELSANCHAKDKSIVVRGGSS
jgi:endonuclease-3